MLSWQAVAAIRASSALHYLWLDVTRQGPFWEGLGVGRGDVPTAVAISLKKRRQASLDSGAFTQEGLKNFVEKLVNGKTSTHPLQAGHRCIVSVGQLLVSQATCISASQVSAPQSSEESWYVILMNLCVTVVLYRQ